MAILSKTTKDSKAQPVVTGSLSRGILLSPRISEKAVRLGNLNQYIFRVHPKANKVEIRKALEKFYDIKIEKINIVKLPGKQRNYGRTKGTMSDVKKAIVTLAKDSKKPAFSAE